MGFFSFVLWNLDLFLDDVRIPLVSHGSCANLLVFMVWDFDGKAWSKAALYSFMKKLYALFGHFICNIGEKSV